MADAVIEGLPEYFEPVRLLGEGGMGVVWSVRDTRVNKVGALKIIRRKADMTPVSITRFEREIRNFAQLIHPYIVQVYDVGQMETGEPYIFMEQVDGRPICAEMFHGRSFHEIVLLIDRILEGLTEAHANNLIHRDLKPDNILITEDEEGHLVPKLMDFGLALRADENDLRITSDGMVVGTPIYMAPEQACDEHYQICPATDFYGIGCILYELFTGEPPFTGTNAVSVMIAQAKDKPKPFTPKPEYAETVRLSSIIMRLLEKMPDRRYDTAADLRAALRRQFLLRDDQVFGTSALKNSDYDTDLEHNKDEDSPFFSTELSPKSYKTILPDIEHCKYNYSVLSLRPPVYVGRTSAKYLLTRYLKDVFQCRRTALAMITGKPGVGKTRFLESFIQDCYRTGTAGSLTVDGSVCSDLRFAVFRALFGKLLLKTLTPPQVKLALCRFIQTDDETDARVRALEAIFQAELEQGVPPRSKMDLVLCDVFAKLTRTRPLVLCFDNIAPEQRTELTTIARELTELPKIKLPILICVVNATTNGMPTDIELAIGNENAIWLRRSITIDPLSNSDMHMLVTHSLGIHEALAPYIENLSAGLPQIAVSLVRQWNLAGFLTPTADGYVSTQPVETLPIPRCVHEDILRLINLTFVDYPARTWMPVAAIAAMYGASFSPKNLANAIHYIPTKQKIISYSSFISLALSGGVLRTVDDTTLAYSNTLMKEALIANLQAYEVQDYHRAIAQALQELDDTIDTQKQIAEHLSVAGLYYDAYNVSIGLAKRLSQCGELDQALDYAGRAHDLIQQHFGFADTSTQEIVDIWFIEADIYIQKNDLDHASRVMHLLEYSNKTETRPERKAQFMLLRSGVAQLENNETLAAAFVNQAAEILNAIPEPLTRDQLEVRFSTLVRRFQYDPTIAQNFIETARRLQNPIFVGKALLAIACHNIDAGDTARAQRILNMTIDTAHKTGDIRTEASALFMLAKVQVDAPEVRIKTLREAMREFEHIADFRELAAVHVEIAQMIQQDFPDEARIHRHWGDILYRAAG